MQQYPMFAYLKYFLYIAWNWNIRLAFFVINDERRGEKKYQVHTTGYDNLKRLARAGYDTGHATIYMPASYYLLEKMFGFMQTQPHNGHILDLGCGRGRALVVAAHHGFTHLTGADISKEFCAEARHWLSQLPFPQVVADIQHQDAFYFPVPETVQVLFLFNPFDEVIMSGVVKNLLESLEAAPRNFYVIYINPQHQELFRAAGFKPVFEHRKLKYLEGVILQRTITE